MKIALAATRVDPADPQSWSGVPWHLAEALQQLDDVELVVLGPLRVPRRTPEAIRKAWYMLRRQRYIWWREPRIVGRWITDMAELVGSSDFDALVALGTESSRCIPPGVPHLLFADATWEANVDYYPTMTGVCRRSLRLSEAMERAALEHADHVVITSDWAKRSLVDHYGLAPSDVTVVPIAANTVCDIDPIELPPIAARRLHGPMRLFWIGVEWDRKGGEIAMEAAAELHRRGVPVELHVAGRYPELEPQPWLHPHGFLDFEADRARTRAIYLASYMLILPTKAEDSGIVFAEAASFAVPSIAPATGGVPTMVANGRNGVLLREHASPTEYADALEALWNDPERYRALAASARARFEREMTWDHVACVIIEQVSAMPRSGHFERTP